MAGGQPYLLAVILAAWATIAAAARIDDATTFATTFREQADDLTMALETVFEDALPTEWKDEYLDAAGKMVGTWADAGNRLFQFRPVGSGLGFFDFAGTRFANLEPSDLVVYEGDLGGTLLRFRFASKARKKLRVEMLETSQLGTMWAPLADFTKEFWDFYDVPNLLIPVTAAEKKLATTLIGAWSDSRPFSQTQKLFGLGGDSCPFKTLTFEEGRNGTFEVIVDGDVSVPLRPGGIFFEGGWDSRRSRIASTRVINRFRLLDDGRIVGESRSMQSAWAISFELVRIAMLDGSMPQIWEGGPKFVSSQESRKLPQSIGGNSFKSRASDSVYSAGMSSWVSTNTRERTQRGTASKTSLPSVALLGLIAQLGYLL